MQISSAGMPGPLLLRDHECGVWNIAGIPAFLRKRSMT
jgi:hypothetical protein